MPVLYITKVSWAISVKFIAIFVILFTHTNIAAAQTALQISGPVVATTNGQVIENLQITANGQPGINVAGYSNVIIRNVEIFHDGGHGIKCSNAPGLTIENVSVTHTGENVGEPWEATGGFHNINCESSDGLTISHARLRGGAAGAYILNTNAPHLSFIEGYDFRGPFPRGMLAQFNNAPNCILEDFSLINTPGEFWSEDNVSVFNSPNCIIRRGLIDGNNSPTGVGVMFEAGSNDGLVQDVDAIRMGNGAFVAWGPDRVQMIRTRWRDNICTDQGRGLPSSSGQGWVVASSALNGAIIAGVWFNKCSNTYWISGTSDATLDISEADFTLRDPIINQFSWEPSVPPNAE